MGTSMKHELTSLRLISSRPSFTAEVIAGGSVLVNLHKELEKYAFDSKIHEGQLVVRPLVLPTVRAIVSFKPRCPIFRVDGIHEEYGPMHGGWEIPCTFEHGRFVPAPKPGYEGYNLESLLESYLSNTLEGLICEFM